MHDIFQRNAECYFIVNIRENCNKLGSICSSHFVLPVDDSVYQSEIVELHD